MADAEMGVIWEMARAYSWSQHGAESGAGSEFTLVSTWLFRAGRVWRVAWFRTHAEAIASLPFG